jgi:GntR family transcriptional regulator
MHRDGTGISRTRGSRPLYVQVANEILRAIDAGRLRVGDRVGSEPELMRVHGVSRATAGKALERLERAGVVRREQGRGTFVQAAPLVQRTPELGSFTESVEHRGQVPSQRLLELETLQSSEDDPLAVYLGTTEPVVRVRRLRLVDGEPVGLHTHLLPTKVAEQAGIDAGSFAAPSASLYELLATADLHVHEAEEHLRAVGASREEAEVFGVTAGVALMRVVRVSYDARRAPLEVADARYLGDRFDYSVALARPGAPGMELAHPSTANIKEVHDGNQVRGRGRADGGGPGHGGRVR